MKNKIVLTIFILLLKINLFAQDLSCNVKVVSTLIGGTEQTVFKNLEQSLTDFVNGKSWTNHTFKENEKIELSLLLNLKEKQGTNVYKASLQIQSVRPVYGSAYKTTMFNHKEEEFTFSYSQFDILDYSEQTNISELTSVVAYYLYIVLGLDYDSFSKNGGDFFFLKAQNIVNLNQSSNSSGWKAFDKNQYNKYWLVYNLLDPVFKEYRTAIYEYHRLGLDQMSNDTKKGVEAIIKSIYLLKKIHERNPNSFPTQIFFNSKIDEIIRIMKKLDSNRKKDIIKLLQTIKSDSRWRDIN